jgi:hypothetical protein
MPNSTKTFDIIKFDPCKAEDLLGKPFTNIFYKLNAFHLFESQRFGSGIFYLEDSDYLDTDQTEHCSLV